MAAGVAVPLVSFDDLLSHRLAPLDANGRQQVLSLLVSAAGLLPPVIAAAIGPALVLACCALRERLPQGPGAARLEQVARLDDRHVYVRGRTATPEGVTLVSPAGERRPIAVHAGHYAAVLSFEVSVTSSSTWVLETREEGSEGSGSEVRMSAHTDTPAAVMEILARDLEAEHVPLGLRECARAVTLLSGRSSPHPAAGPIHAVGDVPEAPRSTLAIVVTGGRAADVEPLLVDLLQSGPQEPVDVLLVVDADSGDGRSLAQLSTLYQVPVRVLAVATGLALADAVNLAVRHAAGVHVVVLRPPVRPAHGAWLRDVFDSLERATLPGVVIAGGGHPESARSLGTSACLGVDKEWFMAAGGLSGLYLELRNDMEDLFDRSVAEGRSGVRLFGMLHETDEQDGRGLRGRQEHDAWRRRVRQAWLPGHEAAR